MLSGCFDSASGGGGYCVSPVLPVAAAAATAVPKNRLITGDCHAGLRVFAPDDGAGDLEDAAAKI